MRVCVLSDIHFPDHDVKAWSLTKKIISDLNLDLIYLLGDIFDMEPVSRFPIDVKLSILLQEHIDKGINELKTLKEIYSGNIKFMRGNHECFAEETEVLTEKGFIPFEKLTSQDKIASVTNNHIIKYVYPQKIHSYEYDGEMYNFNFNKVKCLVTPNHRMYVKEAHPKSSNKNFQLINAENFKKIRYEYVVAGASNLSDYDISDDELKLLAWFCTDGHSNFKRKIKYVVLYQSKIKYIENIRNLLNRMNISYKEKIRNRNIQFIDGKKLKNKPLPNSEFHLDKESSEKIFSLFPHRQELPDFIYNLSDRQVKIFLETMLDGNGSRHKNSTSYVLYGSSNFLDQIQHLLVTHNIACSKYDYFDKKNRKQSRLNITYNCITKPDQTKTIISQQNYVGKVWCLTVPHEKFIIRYKGRVHVTGNSRLNNYLHTKAKALSGLRSLSLRNTLQIDDLDIEYFDNSIKKYDKIGKLYFCHGDENKVGYATPAKNLYLKLHENVICGHFHRFDKYISRSLSDTIHGVYVNGCLQNLDPEWAGFTQWHHGFSVVDFTSSGYFHVEQIHFMKNKSKLIALLPLHNEKQLYIS